MRNSPSKLVSQLKLSSSSCHIIVAVAENDSPEFRKQSEDYYKVSAAEAPIKLNCQGNNYSILTQGALGSFIPITSTLPLIHSDVSLHAAVKQSDCSGRNVYRMHLQ